MWDTTRNSVLSSFQVWDSSGSTKCAAQLHMRRCFLFLKVVIVVLETVSVDQGRWSDLFWSRKMILKWNSSAASCDNLLELSTRIEIYFRNTQILSARNTVLPNTKTNFCEFGNYAVFRPSLQPWDEIAQVVALPKVILAYFDQANLNQLILGHKLFFNKTVPPKVKVSQVPFTHFYR